MSITSLFLLVVILIINAGDILSQSAPILRQDTLAGYIPLSNVTQHARIDLDMQKFIDIIEGQGIVAGSSAAITLYSEGANSRKTTGMRTIKGFSYDAGTKMQDYVLYKLYRDYYQSDRYADDFIMRALNGEGEFKNKDTIMRAECAIKGAQYESILMYVLFELDDAIADCKAGTPTANDANVLSWDEGWAFFTGTLEGVDGSGSGVLHYALAEKRCQEFGTCNGARRAKVNDDILILFEQGRTALNLRDCDRARGYLNQIEQKAMIPLIQGVLRYAHRADPVGGYKGRSATGAEEWAEGWAFVRAILPVVNKCNPSVAKTLKDNFDISNTSPMVDGQINVQKKLETVYSCMNISCADIGGYLNDAKTGYVLPPCQTQLSTTGSSSTSTTLSDGAIAGITIAVLFVYFFSIWICRRSGYKAGEKAGADKASNEYHDYNSATNNKSNGHSSKKNAGDEESGALTNL